MKTTLVKISAVLSLAAVLTLAGCGSEYQIRPLSGTQNTVTLSKQGGVYITVPKDGRYQAINYPGSGQLVAQFLATAFSKYAQRVQTAPAQSQDDGLSEARQAGSQYLVVPIITHWEQRATEWSGIPSRVALRVTIFDVHSGKQLLSEGILGRSSKITLTSTTPEVLLHEPIKALVRRLYESHQ